MLRFLRGLGLPGQLGLFIVALIVVCGVAGPDLLTIDPLATDPANTLQGPSAVHLFGTDNLGRDLFAGIVDGARTAMIVGCLSVVFSLVLGLFVGAIGGYFGGIADRIVMKLTQLFIVIPRLFLAMALVSLFGTGLWPVIITIGLVSWPQVARLTRAEFKTLRQADFVEAAIAAGATDAHVIIRHLIPNTLPTLIANAALLMSSAILLEAGLAFFGLSDPNIVSWGSMLSNAQQFLPVSFWMPLFPGLALSLTGLGLNLLGDSLTRSFSPRLRRTVRRRPRKTANAAPSPALQLSK